MIENGKVTAVRLTGETAAREWLKDAMAQGSDAATIRPWMLAPVSAPPAGSAGRGRILCNCLDVSVKEIADEVLRGLDLAAIQEKLCCGTECGSCLPELKRMVRLPEAA
jgi:assimilatory nitrate reductase catalytic subunit